MLIGKNDLMSIVYDNKEERVIFFDTNGNYINDWFCECFENNKECFIESVKLLVKNEKELVEFFADSIGYNTESYITPTLAQVKEMKEKFNEECINKLGNSYLCLYL